MNELEAVVTAAECAWQDGRPVLMATVVRVRGSAYRRPGARMLLTDQGWQAGSISGGCLEDDIVRKAWWRTRAGEPVVVTYDSTSSGEDDPFAWGFGLGCNGVVEVLLERVTPDDPACPVAFIKGCLQQRRHGVIATVIGIEPDTTGIAIGQRLLLRGGDTAPAASNVGDSTLAEHIALDARYALEAIAPSGTVAYQTAGGTVEVFLERIAPPTPLVICGAGHDVVPLAAMAKSLGWHVTVVDPRPGALPHPERFPAADAVLACAPAELPGRVTLDATTVAVVMSHNVAQDTAALAALLSSSVSYIGVLGPRRRTEMLLSAVASSGALVTGADRVHGPVGLDIGADNPETVALAILAEMQATLAGRDGGPLRERNLPIHGTAAAHPADMRPPAANREPVACALAS